MISWTGLAPWEFGSATLSTSSLMKNNLLLRGPYRADLCLGPYGGPRREAVSSERGAPHTRDSGPHWRGGGGTDHAWEAGDRPLDPSAVKPTCNTQENQGQILASAFRSKSSNLFTVFPVVWEGVGGARTTRATEGAPAPEMIVSEITITCMGGARTTRRAWATEETPASAFTWKPRPKSGLDCHICALTVLYVP